MNDDVIQMIRIQYAINSVSNDINTPRFTIDAMHNLTKQYQAELNLPLTETVEGANTPRAINGDYVKRIFDDVTSKTGICLSRNTYRRVMGILKFNGVFSSNTQNCIMIYLGIRGISWEEFLDVSDSYRQQKLYDLNNISGGCSQLGELQNTMNHVHLPLLNHVHLPLLKPYDLVILEMGKDVKTNVYMQVKLECLDKGVFLVKESRGLQLEVNDRIYTDSTLLKGNMLAFYRVNRNNRWITYVGSHPIKRIKLDRLSNEEISYRKYLTRNN